MEHVRGCTHLSSRLVQQRDKHGAFRGCLHGRAVAAHHVRDVVHVAQGEHVLPVATGRGDALFQQLAAPGQVLLDALAEQAAAAEDALAVHTGQPRPVLQQLHGARFVLRHADALVAAT